MPVRIGDRGRAQTALGPSGKVTIGSEVHDARSEFGYIAPGTECIVVRGDPTGLVVHPVDPDREPDPLPRQGEEAFRRGDAQRVTVDDAEIERKERAATRKAEIHRLGAGIIAAASLGAMVGLAGAGTGPLLGWVPASDPVILSFLLAGGLAAGIAWSAAWFFLLGALTRTARGADSLFAPSFVVLFALLVGTVIGAWSGYLGGGWDEAAASSLLWAGGCSAAAAVIVALKNLLIGA